MGWNLLLALVPFLLAQYLFQKRTRPSFLWLLGFGIFALFLPNAPYVLTDSIHFSRVLPDLATRKEMVLWTGQFTLFILTGLILFYLSFRKLEQFLLRKKYTQYRLLFRLFGFGLVSIGVYWGRFLRFNSWDALVNPQLVLSGIRYLNDVPVIVFVSGFTLFLLALYFVFEKLQNRLRLPVVLG